MSATETSLSPAWLRAFFHRSGDLQPVSDDRLLGGQLVNPSRRVSRDFSRIELAECAAVAIAFLEHDRPAQACLRGFENEEFEMGPVMRGLARPIRDPDTRA
jgi:hypothetical protein